MTDPSYRQALDFLAALLPELAADEARAPVRPVLDPELAARLVAPIPKEGRELAEVFASLRALAKAVPVTTTAPFFNQLFSGRDAVATAADMLASHLNNSMYTYKAAGALILAENQLIAHMLELARFPQGEGTFTAGGSLSNMLALAIARNEAQARHGRSHDFALYTSAANHYSIPKAAAILGLGRECVRKIATDPQGRMRPELLAARLREDLDAGVVPMMINATAATTVMGAFDPIAPLADIAEEHGVWLHVDGAWGGSLLLLDRYRDEQFAALDRCDSLTWDAHKLMGVPLTCSVLLLRETGALARHLGADAEYLFQTHGPELNPGLRSLQCGRRNDMLKLWAAWQHHGDAGYAARFELLLARRDYLIERIRSSPELELSHEPEGLNVCFEMAGVVPDQLCSELNARGLAVVGRGHVNGRPTVRMIVANPDQTEAVLDALLSDLLAVGASLRAPAE